MKKLFLLVFVSFCLAYTASVCAENSASRSTIGSSHLYRADKSIKNQYMKLGAGSDTYSYFEMMNGQDIVDDSAGVNDTLYFAKKTIQQARFQAQDGDDSDKFIDSLLVDFGQGNSVTIFHYFDNKSLTIQNAQRGPGLIENIVFSSRNIVNFQMIKNVLKEGDIGRAVLTPKIDPRQKTSSSQLLAQQPEAKPSFSSRTSTQAVESEAQWRQNVQCKILNSWIPADKASRDTLAFILHISNNGRLTSATLKSSSGDHLTDQVALTKINSASPFTAFSPSGERTVFLTYSRKPACRTDADPRSSIFTDRNAGPIARTPSETPDFGPYIAELQRRLKRNWAPLTEDRNKKVVVLFHIEQGGQLSNLRLRESSGSASADSAALTAVRVSAPFRALPQNYKGSAIPVEFTFDFPDYAHTSTQRNSSQVEDDHYKPDFGPYIAELQRRTKRNWAPATEDRYKKVVVLFHVSRDGRLLKLTLKQRSGTESADNAALMAVKVSAPFRNLPSNFKENYISFQFTFDYTVFGSSPIGKISQ